MKREEMEDIDNNSDKLFHKTTLRSPISSNSR